MGENPNQVIVPVATKQTDGVDFDNVDDGGIHFDTFPELSGPVSAASGQKSPVAGVQIQKKILEHLDLETKKELRLVSRNSRSLTDNFVKFPFSWDRHLREGPDEMAASAASFKDVLSPLWKFWRNDLIGAMVEFSYKHPESEENVLWMAKIIQVEGYFVKLRYLSPEEEIGVHENCIDVWVNLFKTDCAHCIGWNLDQDQRHPLTPPPQILESLLHLYGFVEAIHDEDEDEVVPLPPGPPSWPHRFFLRRIIDAQTIPYTLATKCESALQSSANQRVKVADMVEVFDTEKNDILHVGVVTKIHGCRVLIEYQSAENVQDVWCHQLSERFEVCGWARTVGYEVVVPPGLHVPYSPPSLPASQMGMDGVSEFYPNLEAGMTLEVVNPYKPSSIVAGKIARVLKWGNFVIQINSDEVPAHGSPFVYRSVKSLDVFYSGFAVENEIPLEAPFHNQNDSALTPVPKELLQKIPLENPFMIDELLEAFDWWDFLLRPAKIVQVTGRLVKVCYLGFSPEMDQWVDVCSRDIYPMGWGSLRDFPIQAPLDFEL